MGNLRTGTERPKTRPDGCGKLTKPEMKRRAKDILCRAIGCAYYSLEKEDSLTEEEKREITAYINKYGAAARKAFGEKYCAF